MRRLVPLQLPGGPSFVTALQRAWADGDAVLPVDTRLPASAVGQLLTAMRLDDPVDDDDALVVATSGSTGEPKGVVLTHTAVRASALATSARLDVDPERDHWLACLPLGHVGGLSVVTRALITGTRLTVHDGFDAGAVDRAAGEGVTLVSLVATALGRIDPSHFRSIVLGGSAAPADLPPNVVTTYGMTETSSGVVYDGRALDGVELRIDARGQIHLRGPMLLRCYRDGTQPFDRDGWFPTGDLGEIDSASGTLTVHGRAGDLIITGGENVWPEPVEAVLGEDPKVADVAVVGRADDEWGQRVVAVIVPADRHDPPTLEQVREAVRGRIGPWAAPRAIELVTVIPRTALGKIRRQAL